MASSYATAYLITEENIEALTKISTKFNEETLRGNLNWVAVVDYQFYYPRYYVLPERIFKDRYRGIEYSKPVGLF